MSALFKTGCFVFMIIVSISWYFFYGIERVDPRGGDKVIEEMAIQESRDDEAYKENEVGENEYFVSGDGKVSGIFYEQKNTSVKIEATIPISSFFLLALFQTYDQRAASAVVFVKEYGAYRYKVGDFISDNVILSAILPDRVLLRFPDGIKSLGMASFSEMFGDQKEDYSSMVKEPEKEAEQPERNSIMKQFDLYPVTYGEPNGYIIGEKFPEDLAKQSGVKPGDILVSVNGYPVGELSHDSLAQISVRDTMKASVVIRRDGREFIIRYPEDVQ